MADLFEYRKPRILFTAHLETIYPALLRRVDGVDYTRERIATPDDDFLDIDWLKSSTQKVVIISHGLEGNSHRAYIKGMARVFHEAGYSIAAWNYRGCSGEVNRQRRFYHSGATDDLQHVVEHVAAQGFQEMYLIGFSLGGNLSLKYLSEGKVHSNVKGAAVFSVPLDLHSSCVKISTPSNRIYANRFLRHLKEKIRTKAALRQDLDDSGLEHITTLQQFDDRFTAPLHGFRDAVDYYRQCSALYRLSTIEHPTLVVNAQNDPFLSAECFPKGSVNARITFEYPKFGGHVGFTTFGKNGVYWSEHRALAFIKSLPS